ncbi:complement factor H-like [Tyto alba]|uniref:complement factor H-like n=1 Tax=Tyto alba TaxID=56313 RepID=UPI001C671B09|nr:complement factor H-like [Tyto alba]
MTLLSHTMVLLLWMSCTACKASAGAVCEDPPLVDFGEIVSGHKLGYKENDRVQYTCNPGYTLSGSEWVTCHEKIWTPRPPQCLAPCTITKQQLEAQNLLLSSGQRRTFLIQSGQWQKFMCVTGFKLTASSIEQCFNGHIKLPSCIAESLCLPPQPVECAEVLRLENQSLQIKKEGKTYYLAGTRFKYVSRSGYMLDGPSEITCSMGNWTSAPACLEMPCGSIPKVANAQTEGRNKEIYEPGETIRYQCDAGFLIVGPPEIICREGNWTAPPICEDVSCGAAPEIPNARMTSTQEERYLPGARLQYECESNFQMTGGNYVTCTNGEWTQAPTCRDVTCEPPPEIAGGKVEGVKKSRYLPGESARYQCWKGFEMTGASNIACQNGTWTELPKCKGKGGKCGPPPVIENGDLLSFPMQEYPQGTILEYKCPSLYVLEGSQYITCTDGQWTSPPVCLVACTASEEDMSRNNIEPKWIIGRKLYASSGDFIEFRCKRGYMEHPASPPFRAQCMDGTIQYPQCSAGVACTASEEDMSRNNIEPKWIIGRKLYASSGDFIEFRCKRGYMEHPASPPFRAQCVEGTLEYPHCKPGKNCMVRERIMERNHIQLQSSSQSSTSYRTGDYILFECKWWYRQVSRPEKFRAQCLDGAIVYPMCERIV